MLTPDSNLGMAGDAARLASELSDALIVELHICGSSGVVDRGKTSGSNDPPASEVSWSPSSNGGSQLLTLSSAMQQSADHIILT